MAEKNNKRRFEKIIIYLKRYRQYLLFGFLAIAGANGLMLVNPYLVKFAFDKLEQKAPSEEILKYAVLIVILSVISGVFRFMMRRTIIWMSRKIEYDLRSDLFVHLLKMTPSFYHNTRTGDIMARSTNDIEAVRMMLGPGIMHLASTITTGVAAIVLMSTLSLELTLYSLIPLPVLSLAVFMVGNMLYKRYARVQEYFSVLTAKVQENLSGVRVIRAYSQEKSEIDDFARHNREFIRLNIRHIKVFGFMHPIMLMLAGSAVLMVFYFGGMQVINNEISLGTMVAFFAYLAMLIWPMIALGWVTSLYQRGTASLDRLNRIFHTDPEIETVGNRPASVTINGKIEFKNLNFAYKGATILKDINLTIEPGMTLGIVGPTASGKTTLVSLLGRLFPVGEGQLYIDGTDINNWNTETLRAGIGFVPQEPFLFSDTIENNILFGADNGTFEDAQNAATTSAIDEEIESFPSRYETLLGERGINLSGGQKQRVAIARAIAVDPKIIILDDATSAVDTETEDKINRFLKDEIKKRTAIIISHRISAVKDVDLIIYLDDGQIVESGTHEELLSQNGYYARLYKTQLIQQELDRM